jgi:hypothetical protein
MSVIPIYSKEKKKKIPSFKNITVRANASQMPIKDLGSTYGQFPLKTSLY